MKKVFTSIIVFMLYLVGGGLIGGYSAFQMSALPMAAMFFFALLFFLLSIYINMINHELGHMIFGCLSGYEIMSIRFGNKIFVRQPDGTFIKKNFSIPGTGGQCLMRIKKYTDKEHYHIFWYHAGGGISNIIFGAVHLLLCFVFADIPVLNAYSFSVAVFAFIFAIINLVPFPGLQNDGRNIAELMKNSHHCRLCSFNSLEIYSEIIDGKRLKDMDDSLFEFDSEGISNPLIFSIAVINIERLMDKGDFDGAKILALKIQKESECTDENCKNLLKANLLFLELISDRDETAIKAMYDKKLAKYFAAISENPGTNRIEYAYNLLFLKNEQEAQKHLKKFEKNVLKYPFECEIEYEREMIAYVDKIYGAEVSNESFTSEICR